MPTKNCTKCGTEYPDTAKYFYRGKTSKNGLLGVCKVCNNKRTVAYYQTDKGKLVSRKAQLKVVYGITTKDWDEMYSRQRGCCAICEIHQSKLKRRLQVDHNHNTGKVRGLLCPRCNVKLVVIEDKEFLEKSKIYLIGE